MKFEAYPFEKLNALLHDIQPNMAYALSSLTVGEPQFDTPHFIQNSLQQNSHLLNKYPKTAGEEDLKEAMLDFVHTRFNVALTPEELIPTFGTREVLFNFPQFYLFDKPHPTMAFPNPFYQIYEGAAIASRAEVIHMNLTPENNFQAHLSDEALKKCDLVILNYPNNPTSATMSLESLTFWAEKALALDFVLINDECYSEIYFDETNKPHSLLEASLKANNPTFKNILVLNSISKRSSAPGLRSGFIAGDAKILKEYLNYRTYVGCASPVPLQQASAQAWKEESHVKVFQETYKENLHLAKDILGIPMPSATFYIWLKVKDELEFTRKLYQEKNIKVLPGSFLGRNGQGQGYVRIALVENALKTKEVLTRLKEFMNEQSGIA